MVTLVSLLKIGTSLKGKKTLKKDAHLGIDPDPLVT